MLNLTEKEKDNIYEKINKVGLNTFINELNDTQKQDSLIIDAVANTFKGKYESSEFYNIDALKKHPEQLFSILQTYNFEEEPIKRQWLVRHSDDMQVLKNIINEGNFYITDMMFNKNATAEIRESVIKNCYKNPLEFIHDLYEGTFYDENDPVIKDIYEVTLNLLNETTFDYTNIEVLRKCELEDIAETLNRAYEEAEPPIYKKDLEDAKSSKDIEVLEKLIKYDDYRFTNSILYENENAPTKLRELIIEESRHNYPLDKIYEMHKYDINCSDEIRKSICEATLNVLEKTDFIKEHNINELKEMQFNQVESYLCNLCETKDTYYTPYYTTLDKNNNFIEDDEDEDETKIDIEF